MYMLLCEEYYELAMFYQCVINFTRIAFQMLQEKSYDESLHLALKLLENSYILLIQKGTFGLHISANGE